MQRVYIQSFGCRASQADGDGIAASLESHGLTTVAEAGEADLIVLNTCTVTASADAEARHLIRRYHRDHPNAQILVTGCYAQRSPEELAEFAGVRWVVGNSHKSQIADLLSAKLAGAPYHGRVLVSDVTGEFRATSIADIREDRTRPNLKIQDGCSNKCSFCIIPSVRGRSRSAPLDDVVAQVRQLAARYAEVVLTGINLGRWGRDLPGTLRFPDLLRTILRETDVKRLRISSVEPMDWSSDLLELVATETRLAKHVHAPLQAGSDAVLKRMFRKYRTRHYATRVEMARRFMPDAAIGADVMAGFPGETEDDFRQTMEFVAEQPFTYLHVFTYSERPGTAAAEYAGAVPMEVRRERNHRLRELSDEKNLAFRRSMSGKTLPAVTLEQRGIALTTNYLKVELAHPREPNQLIEVEIGGVAGQCLREWTPLRVIG
ncbi:MAG: tRNA (N(6)-L-threonylcarbamoyladenosine(37)-C(2))-methylthiotransferase MtaB [Bryobacteraceae bacterium]